MAEGDVKDDVPEAFWETAARTKMGSYLTSVKSACLIENISSKVYINSVSHAKH
jgi:hypothetical protein